MPLEVGALAGHLQQQVGGQAEEAPLDVAGVEGAQHRQHALQRGGGQPLLLAPEVTHVEPEKGEKTSLVYTEITGTGNNVEGEKFPTAGLGFPQTGPEAVFV